jgi:hypothetical protein
VPSIVQLQALNQAVSLRSHICMLYCIHVCKHTFLMASHVEIKVSIRLISELSYLSSFMLANSLTAQQATKQLAPIKKLA